MYQFTKSIGFQVKGEDLQNIVPSLSTQTQELVFKNLNKQFKILIENFKDSVFFQTFEGEYKAKKRLEIKYKWVKQYAKDKFYENKLHEKKTKICTIENTKFLEEVFQEWVQRNKKIQEKIEEIISQPQESKEKESDLNLLLKQLFSSEYFFCVQDFPKYAKDKDSDQALKKLQKSIEIFKILLEQSLDILSPNQTTGVEVARASFNFYTVNKTSKYINGKTIDDVIVEKKEEQTSSYKKSLLDRTFLQNIGFEKYLKNWEGEILEDGTYEKYSATNAQELSFQELYSALKDFRAKQKSAFNEAIYQDKWKEEVIQIQEEKKTPTKPIPNINLSLAKGKTFQGFEALGDFYGLEKPKQKSPQEIKQLKKQQIKQFVQNNFPLFDASEDILWEFVKLTEEIKELGNKKNNAKGYEIKNISEQLKQKREKRGLYFKENWGFKDYSKEYCDDIYQNVAIHFGKLKAEIRGLEQEKIESRLLNYWANILDDEKDKFLVLFPKEKMRSAKEFLQQLQNTSGEKHILSFNSFTLRALDKMIRKNYPKEISEKARDIPFGSDSQKIDCYKKALNGELSKLQLDFSGFSQKISPIIAKNYKTVEDFRLDFEKVSYSIQKRTISNTDIETLKNKFGAIISKITSYDLERNIRTKREHTNYWNNFWTDTNEKENFPVRLNPELQIFYRKPLEQDDKKKQNNRFSKEHFRVSFTLTQNAAQKELKTTFANEEDLIKKIEKFNTEVIGNFIEKTGENLWYFGIDRGNQELATLGVAKWTKEKYEATLSNGEKKKFPTPQFPEIEIFEIKNPDDTKEIINNAKGTKITVKISDNPSYFMKNEEQIEEYFIKKTGAFIDLTTAKIIKGKIILDGDVKTYINLKKANAKRKLFNIFTQIDNQSDIEYCDENHSAWEKEIKGINVFRNAFVIKKQDNQYQILCYFLPKQSKVYAKNLLQEELQNYLNSIRKDGVMQEHTIQQINNLRDAITANMVGIISFLHEKYPAIINLENLQSKKEIDKHRRSNEESIARRLEWALYRKFQKKGLVPPNLKQTIFLREDSTKPLNHFGIIHFIPTEKTSSTCPYCKESTPMSKRKNDKFNGEHFYKCYTNENNCGFSTNDNRKNILEYIKNSDSVASYNIAQIEIKKQNEKKRNSRARPSNRRKK